MHAKPQYHVGDQVVLDQITFLDRDYIIRNVKFGRLLLATKAVMNHYPSMESFGTVLDYYIDDENITYRVGFNDPTSGQKTFHLLEQWIRPLSNLQHSDELDAIFGQIAQEK